MCVFACAFEGEREKERKRERERDTERNWFSFFIWRPVYICACLSSEHVGSVMVISTHLSPLMHVIALYLPACSFINNGDKLKRKKERETTMMSTDMIVSRWSLSAACMILHAVDKDLWVKPSSISFHH